MTLLEISESEWALMQVYLHVQGICFHDRIYRSATEWQWLNKNTDNRIQIYKLYKHTVLYVQVYYVHIWNVDQVWVLD